VIEFSSLGLAHRPGVLGLAFPVCRGRAGKRCVAA
jgi:hypothetical protein